MPSFRPFLLGLILVACGGGATSAGAQMSAEEQIARALLAAPETMRDGATVLGYGGQPKEGDALTVLRSGTGDLVCLADDPSDDRFHVACYHESLDPFMALGRRLSAEGADRPAILEARQAAIDAGEMDPPAAALWSLTAPADVDPASEPGEDARRLSVLYVPYATADEIGLPTQPDGGSPWLMLPGTPWAHVMISR